MAEFVPPDFEVPLQLETSEFVLEPLGPQHNEQDYNAWTSSIEHIAATPGFHDRSWPREMSLDENRADLQRHADDFRNRTGFTYTVLDPASRDVIGCVYIYPLPDRDRYASARSWVRESRAELDTPLWRAVGAWLASDWPFRRVEYAPLTRPFRHGRLDAVRDRLSYRTAVFGLVRLDTVRRLGARYTTGLRTGEDIEFGLRLWFDSPRIDYAAHAPAYLVHHDATDRTLASDSTFRSDLAAASAMIATPWLAGRSQDEKLAIAVKLARVHLFDAARRVRTVPIEPADADAAVSFVSTLDALAPGWRAPFNRADARALESLATGDIGGANSAWDAATRRNLIFAPTALGTLHRESTLRRYLRYRLPR